MDFNKIRSKDLLDDFYTQYKKNVIALVLYLVIIFSVAGYWMMSITIDFDNIPECHEGKEHRRMHSICNAWLIADILISFGTVFAVAFEFHVGQVEFTRKFRNRIQFAHLFTVDKFLKSDPYAGKDELVNLSLDNKLKKIVEKNAIADMKKKANKEEEVAEEERDENKYSVVSKIKNEHNDPAYQERIKNLKADVKANAA